MLHGVRCLLQAADLLLYIKPSLSATKSYGSMCFSYVLTYNACLTEQAEGIY